MIVAEGLEWKHVYWLCGPAPRTAALRNDVTDPPCNGWQHAFVVPGDKRSVIFCPYSMAGYQVSNQSLEITGAVEPPASFRKEWVVDLILRNWESHQRMSLSADYDTAALVLKKLGADIPTVVISKDGTEDTRSRGGKPVGEALLKAVPPDGKRGKFLKWFLDSDGTRSVREAMAEFGMTRSNVLSYLHTLNKDHGIGYDLVGDAATIILPADCSSPFKNPAELAQPKTVHIDDDDSWLD